MQTYRLIVTPTAGADLKEIYDYVAADSVENARRLIDRILSKLESLCDSPRRTIAGIPGDDHPFPIRMVSVGHYTVYYRSLDRDRVVRVVHVRHGARRRPTLDELS